MTLNAGDPLIGFQVGTPTASLDVPRAPSPYLLRDATEVLVDLASRIFTLEALVDGKVDLDRIRGSIITSGEDILIAGDQIAVLGTVTFADWLRDDDGNITGDIEHNITQISGNKVRTGLIFSENYDPGVAGSAFDLDAGTIQVGANFSVSSLGYITATGGNFSGTINAGTLNASNVLVNGVSVGTIQSQSGTAYTHTNSSSEHNTYTQALLNSTAAKILRGYTSFNYEGALRAGTLTVDGSGNLTGGTGVAITQQGIVGAAAGVTTFTVDASTGAATFKGDITGASGNFEGNVLSTGYLEVTGTRYNSPLGEYASIFGVPSDTTKAGIYGKSGSATGVIGKSSSYVGVYGSSVSGSGVYGTVTGNSSSYIGVYGYSANASTGVKGYSFSGTGIHAQSGLGDALVTEGPSSIGGNIFPTTDQSPTCGTETNRWYAVHTARLYTSYLYPKYGESLILTDSNHNTAIATGTGINYHYRHTYPSVDNTHWLGYSTLAWANLYVYNAYYKTAGTY